MKRRFLTLVLVVVAIWLAQSGYELFIQPDQASSASVAALNGGPAEAASVRAEQAAHNAVPLAASSLTLLAALLCLTPTRRRRAR